MILAVLSPGLYGNVSIILAAVLCLLACVIAVDGLRVAQSSSVPFEYHCGAMISIL